MEGAASRDSHAYGAVVIVRKIGHRLSAVERGERTMPPRPHAVPGTVDVRGCSSATTPTWPRLAAIQSGV